MEKEKQEVQEKNSEEIKPEEKEMQKESHEDSTNKKEKKEKKKSKKKVLLIVLLLLVIVVGAVAFIGYKQKQGSKEKKTITTKKEEVTSEYRISGNSLEAFDLHFLQLENNEKNKIYSPLSIKYALEMLAEGASGDSKDQIVALIGDYESKKYTNSANISLANAMFIRDSFEKNIRKEYSEKLVNKYNADIIYDPFKSANRMNNWVGEKTFGLIKDLLDDDTIKEENFVLINALAIDMEWKNLIQCASGSKVSCLNYSVNYPHEKFSDYVDTIMLENYPSVKFNGQMNAKATEIAASINNYDIVETLGEENIRKTVGDGYDEYIANGGEDCGLTKEEFLDKYIKEIDSSYQNIDYSTDFSMYDDEEIKVFAKDLKTYDGTTLQYVGIMPKEKELKSYIDDIDATKLSNVISNLKGMELNNFEEGKVTHITGFIPLFKYDYELNLIKDLQSLGVKNIFDINKADLSNMLEKGNKSYIDSASHKASIEFSNEGIKAAAATEAGGAGAASCGLYEYEYEVPIKEINLTFDKPYLYLIRDKDSGEVWFVGTVYEPLGSN